MTVRLGTSKSEWYSLGASERSSAELKLLLLQHSEDVQDSEDVQGFHPAPEQTLAAKNKMTGQLVLEQSAASLKTGQYFFSVNIDIPFVSSSRGENEVRQSFPFTVTIAPADPSHLRAVAQSLRETIMLDKTPQGDRAAIAALIALPKAQSVPVLSAVASDPALPLRSCKELAEQLAVLASAKAVTLLADMYWNPAQKLSTGFPGLDYSVCIPCLFRQMHATGSPALKKQIETLFVIHDEKMP